MQTELGLMFCRGAPDSARCGITKALPSTGFAGVVGLEGKGGICTGNLSTAIGPAKLNSPIARADIILWMLVTGRPTLPDVADPVF